MEGINELNPKLISNNNTYTYNDEELSVALVHLDEDENWFEHIINQLTNHGGNN